MSKTALLIIDVQNNMFDEADPAYQGKQLLLKLQSLIGKARAAQVPIVYVQHCGDPGEVDEPGTLGWEIHPDIRPEPTDPIVQKTMPDSFFETTLKDELTTRGIEKLVIAGLQTEYCVDTTCRRACSEGYEIVLVQDGHSTWSRDEMSAAQIIAHHNSVLGDWFAKLESAADVRFVQ
ncbi:cysteine hydrolase [Chloroflexi bacterium TSY]|nr:cysteine hydrolase [Chloroflexi bacterium TSY]